MVAAGYVRALVVCLRLCVLGTMLDACACVGLLVEFGCSGGVLMMLRSAKGVRAMCDGLERCCGVIVVCSICEIGCVLKEIPVGDF